MVLNFLEDAVQVIVNSESAPLWATILAIIIPATASVAAFISCILLYKTTRPKINFKVLQTESSAPKVNMFFKKEDMAFAIILVEITNAGNVGSMISDIEIIYKDKTYPAVTTHTNYDISGNLTIAHENTLVEIDAKDEQLLCPVLVPPYSIATGYIVFPKFFADGDSVDIAVNFKRAYGYHKVCTTPSFTLYNATTHNLVNRPLNDKKKPQN